MITTAQKDTKLTLSENDYEKPDIYFLFQNGTVDQTEYFLENNHFLSVEDHKTLGKVEVYTKGNKYFLKQYRGGRPGEFLPDPYGSFYKPEDLSAKAVQRGTRFCEYLEVKESLFTTYQTYLINRNPLYFKSVEKAVANREHI